MPIGLEVNDYDSDADVSSTEDETLNVPATNKKNKKIKKKKVEKKSILKESKYIKDKAKEKIKSMENEVKDINSVNYLDDSNKVTFGEDNIHEFYTDEELADQFKELERLNSITRELWSEGIFTHAARPRIVKPKYPMLGMRSVRQNNSRTTSLNTTSRVNTNMSRKSPLLGGSLIKKRSYRNIGRMW
tara:strand:+ start:1031 stop:1594 length:564 start_codon:yes stop_codon:yes gene_type:complete